MDTSEYHLQVQRTAHYFTAGSLDERTQQIWFVFHGYGQLASNMIQNFSTLADHGHFIIAPEGLSRFYWDGMTRQPGASWMTKEDREYEIKDYQHYLSQLYHTLQPHFPNQATLNILGFSQGVATAIRWFAHELPPINKAVIWAGEMPPDIDYENLSASSQNTHAYLVLGRQDPFIKEKDMEDQQEFANRYFHHAELLLFDGKHRLDEDTLRKLAGID